MCKRHTIVTHCRVELEHAAVVRIDHSVSREKQQGFSASYANAAPDKLLQLALLSERPALLELMGADGRKGRIRCERGEAVDASIEGVRGKTCVDEVLRIPGGKARVVFLPNTTFVLWRPSGSSQQVVAKVPRPPRRWSQFANAHGLVAVLGLVTLLCAIAYRWPRSSDGATPKQRSQSPETNVQRAKQMELVRELRQDVPTQQSASAEYTSTALPHWLSFEPLVDGWPRHRPPSLIEIDLLPHGESPDVVGLKPGRYSTEAAAARGRRRKLDGAELRPRRAAQPAAATQPDAGSVSASPHVEVTYSLLTP